MKNTILTRAWLNNILIYLCLKVSGEHNANVVELKSMLKRVRTETAHLPRVSTYPKTRIEGRRVVSSYPKINDSN